MIEYKNHDILDRELENAIQDISNIKQGLIIKSDLRTNIDHDIFPSTIKEKIIFYSDTILVKLLYFNKADYNSELHIHKTRDESIICLQGEVLCLIKNDYPKHIVMKEGESININNGIEHSISCMKNTIILVLWKACS